MDRHSAQPEYSDAGGGSGGESNGDDEEQAKLQDVSGDEADDGADMRLNIPAQVTERQGALRLWRDVDPSVVADRVGASVRIEGGRHDAWVGERLVARAASSDGAAHGHLPQFRHPGVSFAHNV